MNDPGILLDVLKVFGLAAFSFFVALFSTPILTHYLYKYELWDKRGERKALGGGNASIIAKATRERTQTPTPYMGGILVWGTTSIVALIFLFLAQIDNSLLLRKLNFISREQTWLPFAALLAASLIGLVDDWFSVRNKGGHMAGGVTLIKRIILILVIGGIGAWWFYSPLETESILVPFVGELHLGILFIPFFILTLLAVFSSGVIDGLDGLAGGVFGSIIAAYGGIAFFQHQIDLAAFLGVISGALLAFLWFNIPPARFYLSETGILGLTTVVTVVAFLTKAVAVLPIIAFPLVIEAGSVILQVSSKKFRGKKIFIAAPIHHHLEAIGWPHYKITMRFWIVSIISAIIGMVIHLVGTY